MDISALIIIVQQTKCGARIKPKDYPIGNWSWLIEPVPNYIESGGGPWPFRDVEWVDINPIREERIGKLVPLRTIDKTDEVELALNKAEITYEVIDGVIRVYF